MIYSFLFNCLYADIAAVCTIVINYLLFVSFTVKVRADLVKAEELVHLVLLNDFSASYMFLCCTCVSVGVQTM